MYKTNFKGSNLKKIRKNQGQSTKNVCKDSTQSRITTAHFQIGDYLRYTNAGHNEMVELMDIKNNKNARTEYTIKFLRGNICFTTDPKENPIRTSIN